MGWCDIDSYQNASDALLDIGMSRPDEVEIIVLDPQDRHCQRFFNRWVQMRMSRLFRVSYPRVYRAIRYMNPQDFHINYFYAADLIEFWITYERGEHIFDVYFP